MFSSKKSHLPDLPWPKQRKPSHKKRNLLGLGVGAALIAGFSAVTKKDRNP